MPFTDTSRNIRLDGATLLADCKFAEGKYKPSSISLDGIIGVVEGNLRWGYKNFSKASKNIKLEGSQLAAEVKGKDDKWHLIKLDLNAHIHNNKGTLESVNIRSRSITPSPTRGRKVSTASSVDLKMTDTPSKVKAVTGGVYGASAAVASAASASSIATAASSSMTSSSSMSSSTSYVSHSTTKQTFSESTFRSQSMQMSIRTTCFNLVLEGSMLWADCLLIDGITRKRSSIDLDQYIGLVNGQLVFGAKGFSKHKHIRNIRLEGFVVFAESLAEGLGERWVQITLDISEKFKNKNGVLIAVTMNADLSVMLSEVPWMKFKVIAEPDMSVFARHPVMKQTMVSIAESTVEHVTVQMSTMIQQVIQQAVSVVTQSAMVHIQKSMETMVQDIIGYGHAHGSATAAAELHMMAGMGAELHGGAYFGAGGSASAGGFGYGSGAVVSGGHANGGSAVGGGFAYGNGSFSASSSETQLTGGALLTASSGSLSSASETHQEFFAASGLSGSGSIVTSGGAQITEVSV